MFYHWNTGLLAGRNEPYCLHSFFFFLAKKKEKLNFLHGSKKCYCSVNQEVWGYAFFFISKCLENSALHWAVVMSNNHAVFSKTEQSKILICHRMLHSSSLVLASLVHTQKALQHTFSLRHLCLSGITLLCGRTYDCKKWKTIVMRPISSHFETFWVLLALSLSLDQFLQTGATMNDPYLSNILKFRYLPHLAIQLIFIASIQ